MASERTDGLVLTNVTVTYGSTPALRSVGLHVPTGSALGLVGPSGCGKTTLLRVIAGLQQSDSGDVVWQGRSLTATPPHNRPVGLMFQDHALFPHRNVAANIAFGLRMQRTPAGDIERRVHALLELVGLPGYADRDVTSLSGGEAQRVALARALAPEPAILLLDEPLGSLDRQLRERLTEEIRAIIETTGVTTIHVTHDQDEAFSIADDVAVMMEGVVQQVGPADVLLAHPASARVAAFLGHHNLVDLPTGPGLVAPADVRFEPTPEGRWEVKASRFEQRRFVITFTGPDGRQLVGESQRRPTIGTRGTASYDESAVTPIAAPAADQGSSRAGPPVA